MVRPADDQLYGEAATPQTPFRFHCETLYSRSSLHRFEIDLHRHENFLQILFFADGEGDATLNGEALSIKPPAIIIAPPGCEHGFRFSRDISGMILTIIPAALPPAAQALARQHLRRPMLLRLNDESSRQNEMECFEAIWNEYSNNNVGRDAMMEGQITTLIAQLSRRVLRSTNTDPVTDRSAGRFPLLLDLIARHIRDDRDSAFYAQQLGISQTQLNRMVRQQSGTSLQRLIAQRRLEIAKQELLFTVSSVQMVATGLGFSDPAYFSRFFLRETGTTPKAWRLAERQRLASVSTNGSDEHSAEFRLNGQ